MAGYCHVINNVLVRPRLARVRTAATIILTSVVNYLFMKKRRVHGAAVSMSSGEVANIKRMDYYS